METVQIRQQLLVTADTDNNSMNTRLQSTDQIKVNTKIALAY